MMDGEGGHCCAGSIPCPGTCTFHERNTCYAPGRFISCRKQDTRSQKTMTWVCSHMGGLSGILLPLRDLRTVDLSAD